MKTIRRVTSYGFNFYTQDKDGTLFQVGVQVSHNGPEQLNDSDRKYLRRMNRKNRKK